VVTAAHTDPLDDGLPIVVTDHALDAQRERCAIQRSVPEIRQEVAAAFMNGRYSSEKPPWCKGYRNEGIGPCLYMWDAEQSRCYVVVEDGRDLVVVTLLIANPDSPFAAVLRFMTATGLRGPT
jgi:hypothetical protein